MNQRIKSSAARLKSLSKGAAAADKWALRSLQELAKVRVLLGSDSGLIPHELVDKMWKELKEIQVSIMDMEGDLKNLSQHMRALKARKARQRKR